MLGILSILWTGCGAFNAEVVPSSAAPAEKRECETQEGELPATEQPLSDAWVTPVEKSKLLLTGQISARKTDSNEAHYPPTLFDKSGAARQILFDAVREKYPEQTLILPDQYWWFAPFFLRSGRPVFVGAGLACEKEDCNIRYIVVGLFESASESSSHDLQMLAHRLDLTPNGIDPPWHPSLMMDIERYRIAENETAIGLVYGNSYQSTSRACSTYYLYLLRYNDNELKTIFEVFESEEIVYLDDDTDSFHRRRVLLDTRKTKGLYDIIVDDTDTGKKVRYRWNGNEYQQ